MKLDIIPVKWTDEGVTMLDQRLLPTEEKWLMLKTCDEVAAMAAVLALSGALPPELLKPSTQLKEV